MPSQNLKTIESSIINEAKTKKVGSWKPSDTQKGPSLGPLE